MLGGQNFWVGATVISRVAISMSIRSRINRANRGNKKLEWSTSSGIYIGGMLVWEVSRVKKRDEDSREDPRPGDGGVGKDSRSINPATIPSALLDPIFTPCPAIPRSANPPFFLFSTSFPYSSLFTVIFNPVFCFLAHYFDIMFFFFVLCISVLTI